nr:hypothetical protein [Tanacetum cinerariifolium]
MSELRYLQKCFPMGWDWSYMANDDENHALVADEEAPSEFSLMAKTSADSNISYLSDYEPFDEGYVSFGQGGCKITGKETIKTDFKLLDDANVLLRTPMQHNMYSIDLNNIVPHKYLTCLVAKASTDEGMLWHRVYEPDDEDQLWTHTQNLMHALVEWKLYDTCGVHHVTSKDKEIFMLVEKNYPLRKGLEIGRIVGNKMHKAFPLPVMEFSLPGEVPTASEESFHCQKKRDATAEKIALLLKSSSNLIDEKGMLGMVFIGNVVYAVVNSEEEGEAI